MMALAVAQGEHVLAHLILAVHKQTKGVVALHAQVLVAVAQALVK